MIDDDVYEITNIDEVEIRKYDDHYGVQRYAQLHYGYIITVVKQVVKGKLKPGQIWAEYPMMKCVRRIYERRKWWQFWKWHKLIGYDVMYIGE